MEAVLWALVVEACVQQGHRVRC